MSCESYMDFFLYQYFENFQLILNLGFFFQFTKQFKSELAPNIFINKYLDEIFSN
jgi:hypothetical protein